MNSLQSFLAIAPVNPVAAAARLPSSRRTRVSACLAALVPEPPAGQPASFSVFIWVKCQAVLRIRFSKTNGSVQKVGRANHAQGEGPSWVLVAGGILLSTLSVRFGCKLKRMFDTKMQKSTSRDGGEEIKQGHASSLSKPDEPSLPLAKISVPESSKENSGVMWTSSLDQLEDHHRPLQYSNSSGSPCISESGYDIYIERKVIQKLRQHLKRRDEMIMEM